MGHAKVILGLSGQNEQLKVAKAGGLKGYVSERDGKTRRIITGCKEARNKGITANTLV